MLAVAGLLRSLDIPIPPVCTTVFVRDDPTANVREIAGRIGAEMLYVDPGFDNLGHDGLARYCRGEVKEGMGAGGAMALGYLMGYSAESIRQKIFSTVSAYS
jgi:NaMN:DMB phosphoribosyltransferase